VSPRLKAIIQYAIIFAITFLLIMYSLRGLQGENKWDYLKETWQAADKGWLFAMAGIAMLSHLIRAERWRMLMAPAGHHPKLSNSFYSLMVGYLVNLVIPRGGELSRCYNLYKLDKTPVDMSFGTVVVERIIDMLCLLILIAVSFAVESEKLFQFINTLTFETSDKQATLNVNILLYIGIASILAITALFFYLRQNEKVRGFLSKTWKGFKQGLLSVFQLKNKWLFILYSITIWGLYFLTSYAVLKAFPTTSELGFGAVLSLFAIGSIAMAAPLPGGTGSYHVLVPQGLVFLYGVPHTEATAFTFIFHGWQTAIMIVCGAASLIITSFLVRKKNI
jgi:uncharacterized protein (TIRG00374 family)